MTTNPTEDRATVLIVGARSGHYLREIRSVHPAWTLTAFAYDCHQARKIREDVAGDDANGLPPVEILCAANLPNDRLWDRACFLTDEKSMSAEMRLDALQDLFAHVRGGDRAPVTGVDPVLRRQVLDRKRTFAAEWTASVPGGEPRTFTTLPGCFCHRRPDAGGLALAETAARLCTETGTRTPAAILDMGCGCGFVGLLVADRLRACGHPLPRLTLVDSHARAIAAATRNAERLDIPATCLLADDGTPADTDGTFDLFLGNPPYYGDWKIAELFLETAHRALRPGGVCLSVAKNPKGLLNVQRARFNEVEVIRRRGYAILRSIR